MMPSRGYLLCCIERTGSNVLVHGLGETGLAGRPAEYFNPVEQAKPWMRDILGDSAIFEGLPKILSAGTTPNGLFGAKVHWNHFRHLGMSVKGEWSDAQRVAPYESLKSKLPKLLSLADTFELLRSSGLRTPDSPYPILRSWMPDLRFIWLRRRNMVARAISHFRARQTGVWYQSLLNGGAVQGGQVHGFNLAEIHILYCLGCFQEELWQQFFQKHGISPHCVTYEELVADYESTVRRVLRFLDIDEPTSIASPVSRKQSDALSAEWEERYRKLGAEAGLFRMDP